MLKIPSALQAITKLCNLSFTTGTIPKPLKLSRVVAIPKVSNAANPDQFRPISITPNLLLLMERLYSNKLESYLNQNSFICPEQFGFRKHHSTEHMVMALTDTIRLSLDKGFVCALVSIDLKKAFDSVHRENLLECLLSDYLISDHWLRDYFKERLQQVGLGELLSDIYQIFAGVPQRSILGPRLFSLYINKLSSILKHGRALLYADDCYFLFVGSADNITQLRINIEEDMCAVANFFKEKLLKIHHD